MILYFAPGACSLADHIALHEAGIAFDGVKVDLRSHTTEDGRDYRSVNKKGYVPALSLDDGELLTENIAILSWIAEQAPNLAPHGPLGRFRLLETLAFISTELHKSFKPFFSPASTDADKAKAGETIVGRLDLLSGAFEGDYIFGSQASVADSYLFVMLMWAKKFGVAVSKTLETYVERMTARPAVQLALKHEGLA